MSGSDCHQYCYANDDYMINFTTENSLCDAFGEFDINAIMVENEFGVKITCRDNEVKIVSDSGSVQLEEFAKSALMKFAALAGQGGITERDARYILSEIADGIDIDPATLTDDVVCVGYGGKPVKPKTLGQKKYAKTIRENAVTIGVGPAGTGKTYLAVALAVRAFRAREVTRIVLTCPAVEAGERLGFLPGDLRNKIDPYLRPLYDALFDIMGAENFTRNVEKGAIEIVPLAYMRGRTLDDSFIILDEAQNTTPEQMKMFLTRLGWSSKMVITGDDTQVDLVDMRGNRSRSGLSDALKVLKNVSGIAICRLSDKDVVRHKLVRDIIKAYEKSEQARVSGAKNGK